MTLGVKLFVIEKAMQTRCGIHFQKVTYTKKPAVTFVLWEGFKSKVLSGV